MYMIIYSTLPLASHHPSHIYLFFIYIISQRFNANYFPHLYRMSQPRIRRRKTPASARGQLNRWVTVYGFDLELASDVFSIFEGFGDIVDHRVSSSNSIDLLFSTRETMEYALAQDGLRLNVGEDNTTCIFIGVKRCSRQGEDISHVDDVGMGSNLRVEGQYGGTSKESMHRSAPPEHTTRSRHGRSIFTGTDDMRYAAFSSSSHLIEPKKDMSCCQMAMRYMFPQSW